MKLLYVHNGVFPQTVANRFQVVNMCEAFTKTGMDTTLLAFGRDEAEIFKFYNVRKKFKTQLLKSVTKNYYLRTIQMFLKFLGLKHFKNVFTRDLLFGYLVKTFFPEKKVVYELHDFSRKGAWLQLFKLAFKKLDHLIVISEGMKKELLKKGFDASKITVLHDGVNKERFDLKISMGEARKRLGLPMEKKIVSYVGTIESDRDLQTLAKAAEKLKEVLFLVYGKEKDFLKSTGNFRLMGVTLQPEMVYKASDILFAGYTDKIRTIKYMSPLKLFEYGIAKRPITVADFPRIREILSEDTAVFYKSEDAEDLTRKIKMVLKDEKLREKITKNCFERLKGFSWEERAKRIQALYVK